MFKHCKGIIAGALIGATVLGAALANADTISKTIDAVYLNIKLVIDGCAVTPKDANGTVVEPFIYNGTTYLPVRAVAEALGENVDWDGDTATVYIGGKVDKPALEFPFYNRPYIECSNPNKYSANEKDGDLRNCIYLSTTPRSNSDCVELGNSRFASSNYVVYPLNGLAKKVKGTFVSPTQGGSSGANPKAETQVRFYNESGKLLYQSPIMTSSTAPINFEFDVEKCISLKVEGYVSVQDNNASSGEWATARIDNFTLVTTDY